MQKYIIHLYAKESYISSRYVVLLAAYDMTSDFQSIFNLVCRKTNITSHKSAYILPTKSMSVLGINCGDITEIVHFLEVMPCVYEV